MGMCEMSEVHVVGHAQGHSLGLTQQHHAQAMLRQTSPESWQTCLWLCTHVIQIT